jgi:hypothetical protein
LDLDFHLAPNVNDKFRHDLTRHQQNLCRVLDVIGDGFRHEVASPLDAGGFGRQRDRAIFAGSHHQE